MQKSQWVFSLERVRAVSGEINAPRTGSVALAALTAIPMALLAIRPAEAFVWRVGHE